MDQDQICWPSIVDPEQDEKRRGLFEIPRAAKPRRHLLSSWMPISCWRSSRWLSGIIASITAQITNRAFVITRELATRPIPGGLDGENMYLIYFLIYIYIYTHTNTYKYLPSHIDKYISASLSLKCGHSRSLRDAATRHRWLSRQNGWRPVLPPGGLPHEAPTPTMHCHRNPHRAIATIETHNSSLSSFVENFSSHLPARCGQTQQSPRRAHLHQPRAIAHVRRRRQPAMYQQYPIYPPEQINCSAPAPVPKFATDLSCAIGTRMHLTLQPKAQSRYARINDASKPNEPHQAMIHHGHHNRLRTNRLPAPTLPPRRHVPARACPDLG